jgi:hypothetical protein
MGTLSISLAESANEPSATSCSANCNNLRLSQLTAEIVRISRSAIAGGSFRKVLARRAKCSLRTIDNWISREGTIQLHQLYNLIEEPDGAACLRAFWESIPDRVRDRFFEEEALRRAIAEKRRLREAEDRAHEARLRQLNMDLAAK